jgi:nitrate/TMAO reductase-like tetraheme cytochrome c subunit
MQDILAILIVLAAAAFLAHRMWQSMMKRRSGTCGACSNCPSNSTAKTPSLVNIGPIMSHAKAQRREDFGN